MFRTRDQDRKHGYAAYAREDVEDAKRGHPGVELRGYAAARGLEFLGNRLAPGFGSLTPAWPEHVFNCNGTILLKEPEDKAGPFGANAIWVPSTKVAIRLPEAALIPQIIVMRKDRLPRFGSRNLGDYGLPGFRLGGNGELGDSLLHRIFGGPAGKVLAGLDYPFVAFQVDHATLSLQRNGYARDDGSLDRLIEAGCGLARAVREAAGSLTAPRAFGERLLRPAWTDPAYRPWELNHLLEWWDVFRRVAAKFQMELEDPAAYHRAFPSIPVPGVAHGVMHGQLPGTTAVGRLAWYSEGAKSERTSGGLDSKGLLESGLGTLRLLGVAEV